MAIDIRSEPSLISVVMPVYNAELYVEFSIRSILSQTYKSFELIIIDDGSTDQSLNIIKKLSSEDDRIVIISRENKGLATSLNEGIAKAKGTWIARMDADDISLPYRLESQLQYLVNNPEIKICSASFQVFHGNYHQIVQTINHPKEPNCISLLLCFCCPVCHPLTIAHKEVFQKYKYDITQAAEDHDLWCRVSREFQIGNLRDILLLYRSHSNSLTSKKNLKIKLCTYFNGFMHLIRNHQLISTCSFQDLSNLKKECVSINWKLACLYLAIAKIMNLLTSKLKVED